MKYRVDIIETWALSLNLYSQIWSWLNTNIKKKMDKSKN